MQANLQAIFIRLIKKLYCKVQRKTNSFLPDFFRILAYIYENRRKITVKLHKKTAERPFFNQVHFRKVHSLRKIYRNDDSLKYARLLKRI